MIKIKAFVLLLPVEQSEIILKNEEYKSLKRYKELLKLIFDKKRVKTVEEMVKKLKVEAGFIEDVMDSKILILPSYVDNVEFLKGSDEASSLILRNKEIEEMETVEEIETEDKDGKKKKRVISKAIKNWMNDKFKYLQFIEGTYTKITGKIVTIDFGIEKEDTDLDGILNYDKLGSEAKKAYRRKMGKNIIEYLSNLLVVNQLSNWAAVKEVPEKNPYKEQKKTSAAEKDGGNKAPAAPQFTNKQAINVSKQTGKYSESPRVMDKNIGATYEKITKSLWVIYFNENEPFKKEESSDDWDDISDADREYRFQLVNQKLESIDSKIKELDEKIKTEIKAVKERELKKEMLLKQYGSETEMRDRLGKVTSSLAVSGISEENKKALEKERDDINDVLGSSTSDAASLNNIRTYRAEQNKLISERKEVERSQIKSKKEYEAEKEQRDIKEWTEELIGIEFGIPVRYIHIPEVNLLSYSETLSLSEKSEGKFEIILEQVTDNAKFVEAGDPISFFKNRVTDLWDSAEEIIGGTKVNDKRL
ncbi:hypothetical protein [Leptotrichia trevisanii]|uniref:hypothetical protein n=1 Tax=Leptotrichia trevisanii TaxID=109328 RepID=UPI0011BEB590|nr:hypothetical protein [Leptotrichia trevisanii]